MDPSTSSGSTWAMIQIDLGGDSRTFSDSGHGSIGLNIKKHNNIYPVKKYYNNKYNNI